MGLIPKFNDADVRRSLERGAAQIHDGIIKIFRYVGEQFVSDARDNLNISGAFHKGDYQDQTTNLRSSIGYFVFHNGVVITADMDGSMTGMMSAQDAAANVTQGQGYELIGVAGMDYASAVESRGYNVITSQADLALVDLKKTMDRFVSRMNNKNLGMDYDIVGNLVTTATR